MGRIIVAGALCGVFSVPAQSTFSLNVGGAAYTVKKELFGALFEHWGRDIYNGLYVGTASTVPHVNGMRRDVIAAFKEGGVTNLDWPGGCFAERYVWTDGTNPNKSARPGGDMTNGMGTPEYFQLCDSIKSIPYITADLTNQTPAQMTAWLNYINTNYPNKLRYWKMGNEPWGGCAGQGIPGISVTAYVSRYNNFKVAIPSGMLGQLFRIADGGTGNGTAPSYWLDSVMRTEMGSMEGITMHYYAGFSGASIGFPEAEWYSRLQSLWNMNALMNTCETTMNTRDPGYTVGLMVDEWGAWYSNVSGRDYPQSTCRDAVGAGMNLNIFINRCRRVQMGCVAQAVNVIQSLILTENPAQNRIVKTPTFYVYKMYKVHQQARMAPVTWSNNPTNQNIPVITASASVDSAGKLHISMINTLVSTAHTVTITLNSAPSYSSCTGTIVNGAAYNSYNDFGTAENVNIQNFTGMTLGGTTVNVTMPAHSVVTLELTPTSSVYGNTFINSSLRRMNATLTADGSIVVHYSVPGAVPVSLALYSADGRTILTKSDATLDPSKKSFVWNLNTKNLRSNAYILKMTVGTESRSQRLVIIR